MPRNWTRRTCLALLIPVMCALAGCGLFGAGANSFTWDITPILRTITVSQGNTAQFGIRIINLEEGKGGVHLSIIHSLANGVASLSDQTLQLNQTATVSVNASTLSPGTYKVTLQGSAVGDDPGEHQTAELTVIVTPPVQNGDWTLELDKTSHTYTSLGDQTQFVFTLTPLNGFHGDISLQLEGAAIGNQILVPVDVPPTQTIGPNIASSSFILRASPDWVPSTVTVNLKAIQGTNVQTKTMTLTLAP